MDYDIHLHPQENRFSNLSLSEQRGSTFYARLPPLEKVSIGFGQGREGFYNSFRMICNNSDNGIYLESLHWRSDYDDDLGVVSA